MNKGKFKMFKYLHRDGDANMSFGALVKRELGEMITQSLQAKKKMDPICAKEFRHWIKYYHIGMFFKPHFSRKVVTIDYREKHKKRIIKISFRKNQSDIYILRENFVSTIYDYDFERYLVGCKSRTGAGSGSAERTGSAAALSGCPCADLASVCPLVL